MAIISNLIARLRADTTAFDRNMKKSRRETQTFTRGVQAMGRQMLMLAGVGGGLYAVKRGLGAITRAAMEQEKAERALRAATKGNITQFKNYAAEMQKLTIYGDEQILSQMAYAKNLGVTEDKLEAAAKAAIGLAAKFRLDLATSMMLVGRASQGQTQMLTRYGIVLSESLSSQDKFNALLKIGADSFRLAEEEARTSVGTWTQFKNSVGDLAEELGGPLADYLTIALRKMLEFRKAVEKPISLSYPSLPKGWTAGLEIPISEMKKYRGRTEDEIKALKEYEKIYEDAIQKGQTPPTFSFGAVQPTKQEKDPWADMIKGLDETNLETAAKEVQGFMAKTREAIDSIRHMDYLTRMERIENLRIYAEENATILNQVKGAHELLNAEILRIERSRVNKFNVYLAKLREDAQNTSLYLGEKYAAVAQSIEGSLGNAFYGMIAEGRSFRDAMKGFAQDVMRSFARMAAEIAARQIMFAVLGQAMGPLMYPGMYHKGGIVGQAKQHKLMPAPEFIGAPRFHSGTDEFPAWLQRNEHVLTPPQMNTLVGAAAGGVGNGKIEVHIHNEGQPLEIKGEPRFDGERLIIEVFNKAVDHNMSFRRKIASIR